MNSGLWHEYLHVQFDPAHLLAELGFTLAFDLAAWLLMKKLLTKILWRWHLDIDREHGVPHKEQGTKCAHCEELPLSTACSECIEHLLDSKHEE